MDFLSDIKALHIDKKIVPLKKGNSQQSKIIVDTLSERYKPLQKFFQALAEAKKTPKKIRISYYGDSMIEGDLITNDLRKSLQKKFGGNGVGFVPIASNVAGFRTSINQTFSKSWTTFSFVAKPTAGYYVGPTGYVYLPRNESFVRFKSSKEYLPFKTARLFFAKPDGANIDIETDKSVKSFTLKGNDVVDEILLHDSTEFNDINR
jgi:hypothetical protein